MDVPEIYLADAWRPVMDEMGYARLSPWPVLITGPRGSGKSMLARSLHQESKLRGAFVSSSAASIPDTLMQSVLLGHVRGAFTDAKQDHRGLLEQANNGLLLLDDIDAASPGLQAFLLALLDSPDILRVGGERTLPVRTRWVFASNAPLERLAEQGRFRADLLDRIRVHRLVVPALREYRDCIPQIVSRMLRAALAEIGAKRNPGIVPEAMRKLLEYEWPGNLRELYAMCCHVAPRVREPFVMLHHLPPQVLAAPRQRPVPEHVRLGLKQHFDSLLQLAGGNISHAARLMGVRRKPLEAVQRLVARITPGGGMRRPTKTAEGS